MRSAKEPLGGGFDDTGGAFCWGVEERLLTAVVAVVEGALGRGLGAVDTVDFAVVVVLVVDDVAAALVGAGVTDFAGRASCSSAFRLIPETRGLRSEAPSRGTLTGLRTSVLAFEEVTGGDGEAEVGGIGDGLPVSIDERTESRNCRMISKSHQTAAIHRVLTLILSPSRQRKRQKLSNMSSHEGG